MEGINIVCYADDIALISKGPDLEDCVARLQRGVDAVEQWAHSQSLRLSHSKSETLLLTQKNKYSSIVESTTRLSLGGIPVNYAVGPVRYLGIWLDRKLSWNDHVKIKCDKVRKLLMKVIFCNRLKTLRNIFQLDLEFKIEGITFTFLLKMPSLFK